MTPAAISGIIRNVLSGLILAGIIWALTNIVPLPGQLARMEARQRRMYQVLTDHLAADAKRDDAARNMVAH